MYELINPDILWSPIGSELAVHNFVHNY